MRCSAPGWVTRHAETCHPAAAAGLDTQRAVAVPLRHRETQDRRAQPRLTSVIQPPPPLPPPSLPARRPAAARSAPPRPEATDPAPGRTGTRAGQPGRLTGTRPACPTRRPPGPAASRSASAAMAARPPLTSPACAAWAWPTPALCPRPAARAILASLLAQHPPGHTAGPPAIIIPAADAARLLPGAGPDSVPGVSVPATLDIGPGRDGSPPAHPGARRRARPGRPAGRRPARRGRRAGDHADRRPRCPRGRAAGRHPDRRTPAAGQSVRRR